jgi:hypothetical protein
MSRIRFSGGKSRQQNERPIVRRQNRWDGGEEKRFDVESIDISSNSVAKLVNARGHRNYVEGRGGSEKIIIESISLSDFDNNTETLGAAMQTGSLYAANGNTIVGVGDAFTILKTSDFISTPLATPSL